MSVEATPEQEAIIARLKQLPKYDARVHRLIPEEQRLEKDEYGLVLDYLVVTFGSVYPLAGDRSIEGPEQQPQGMPIIVECWSAKGPGSAAQGAGNVRTSLLGFQPTPDNSTPIELRGGGLFDRRDGAGRPVRWMESVTALTGLNMSYETD